MLKSKSNSKLWLRYLLLLKFVMVYNCLRSLHLNTKAPIMQLLCMENGKLRSVPGLCGWVNLKDI